MSYFIWKGPEVTSVIFSKTHPIILRWVTGNGSRNLRCLLVDIEWCQLFPNCKERGQGHFLHKTLVWEGLGSSKLKETNLIPMRQSGEDAAPRGSKYMHKNNLKILILPKLIFKKVNFNNTFSWILFYDLKFYLEA